MNNDFLKYLDDLNIDDEMDRMFDEPDRYATMLYRTSQLQQDEQDQRRWY